MSRGILAAGLAVALPLLGVLGAGLVRGEAPPAGPAIGGPAPSFDLPSADGAARLTSAGLRGRPAVVSFWATWCSGCREEHAALQAVAREYRGRAAFLGISVDDDAGAVRRFLDEHGAEYPVALDRQSRVAATFGVAGVPQTFVLDAQGAIVAAVQGPADGPVIREVLDVLLAAAER